MFARPRRLNKYTQPSYEKTYIYEALPFGIFSMRGYHRLTNQDETRVNKHPETTLKIHPPPFSRTTKTTTSL